MEEHGNGSAPATRAAEHGGDEMVRTFFQSGVRLRAIVTEHRYAYEELFEIAHVLYYALTVDGQNGVAKPPERPAVQARIEDETRALAQLGRWFQRTVREHVHDVASLVSVVETLETTLGAQQAAGDGHAQQRGDGSARWNATFSKNPRGAVGASST